MQNNWPITREVVLIGGGHAHALVLRKWGMNPLPGARLTVINPGPTAPYTGMLPGFIAGHYGRAELDIDLVPLARFANARLILGKASAIDRAAKMITVPGRPSIPYDITSIDIGITSAMPNIPGFVEHAIPAKPLGVLSKAWASFLERAKSGATPAQITLIGGGVAGVELSLAMAHALTSAGCTPEITLIDRSQVLTESAAPTRARLKDALKSHNITVLENTTVTAIAQNSVTLDVSRTDPTSSIFQKYFRAERSEGPKTLSLPSHFTTGAAGAFPYSWLASTGLALENGFIKTDPQLRSETDPSIYAVGDCAHITHAPRPKAGVYAVRAAPILYHNLIADLTQTARRPFNPQKDFLKLISLGGKSALAEKFGRAASGPWLWRWKNQIDQKFMDKFRAYPEMPREKLPARFATGMDAAHQISTDLCGGCGAKIGSDPLAKALANIPQTKRPDIALTAGDDAAVLSHTSPQQVISHDHLRAFCADPYTMAKITAIHALGDIWSMGASPQSALAAITLPQLSPPLQSQWLSDIMQGAAEVFGARNAAIVGGHTSSGSELIIGFTVTGLLDERPPITLSGAQPGDILVLTKPIGSGVLLAAEMALKAHGDDYAAALKIMAAPQAEDAQALAHANAMTDVTGFGLAGHLLEICKASGVAARLDLSAVPLMAGAENLAAAGIRSTLFAQNRANFPDAPNTPRADLMFDPQTAGGLLAAVPPGQVTTGTVIGEITQGPPHITFENSP